MKAMGRFAEPGLWILGALGRGPLELSGLFDVVASINGRVRPGTLLGALVRLEQHLLVTRVSVSGLPMYRLTSHITKVDR